MLYHILDQEWCSTNKIISDVQFEFQPNHSAVDAIISLQNLILLNSLRKKNTVVLLRSEVTESVSCFESGHGEKLKRSDLICFVAN